MLGFKIPELIWATAIFIAAAMFLHKCGTSERDMNRKVQACEDQGGEYFSFEGGDICLSRAAVIDL